MNAGTLALLIPIIAIVGSFIVSIMKLREKQLNASAEHNKHNQALHDELNKLRERVEVLERLVTDDSFQLKRELDKF
jgi:phage shock protein B